MKKKVIKYSVICIALIILVLSLMVACSTSTTKHTISFKIQNDSDEWVSYASVRSAGNEIITLPSSPSKSGYVFYGWYKETIYSTEIVEYTYESTAIEEDVVAYAKFVPATAISESYSVTFDSNGGSVVASSLLKFRDVIPETSVPTKTGSTFAGWYTNSELTNAWNLKYDRVRSNLTLYAKWEEAVYNVQYELAGGECSETLQSTYSLTTTLAIPADSTFTRTGYTFSGIYIDSNFETSYNASIFYGKDLTLYVKWSVITYNITYHIPEGASLEGTNPTSYNLEDGLTLISPSQVGYNFAGWYLTSDYSSKLNYNCLPSTDIDLYALFTEKRYTITYTLNGGVNNTSNKNYYKYFDSSVVVYNPTKRGYTFEGWYTDSGLTTSFTGSNTKTNILLYAKWSLTNFTITYHVDASATFDDEDFTSYTINTTLTLPTPSYSGYVFNGWYLNSDYSTKFDADEDYAENLDLYARFVDEGFIDPTTYVEAVPLSSITFLSSETKNLCIPQTDTKADVVSSSIGTDNYIYYNDDDSTKIIVIKKSYLDNFDLGEKIQIILTYNDSSTKTYYVTLVSQLSYEISVPNYSKFDDIELDITFTDTIAESNIYEVTIDGNTVDYSVDTSTNQVVIDNSIVDLLNVGKHYIRVYTTEGISVGETLVTNDTRYYPQNVRIDVDSSFPNVYVYWDYDYTATKFTATIGGVSYNSVDNATLFSDNSFNATGLLKVSGTTVVITATYNSVDYNAPAVTFGVNLYTAQDSTTYATGVEETFDYDNGFTFYGKQNNLYITSWAEFYDLLFYTMLYSENWDVVSATYNSVTKDYNSFIFTIDFDLSTVTEIDYTSSYYSGISESDRVLTNASFIAAMICEIFYNIPEATSYSMLYKKCSTYQSVDSQSYQMYFIVDGDKTPTTTRTLSDNSTYANADAIVTHYGSGLSSTYAFPIESNNKGDATVNTSIELYLALENGYNPVIPAANTALQSTYNNAKAALKSILDTSMTDYQMVLAIYDYLTVNVVYDYSLATMAESLQGTEEYKTIYGYSSFYLEGVFNQGTAVCNGIAAAYSVMCNMMGIPCHKLSGLVNTASITNGAHAWVEVCIGDNWYISDATWANYVFNASGLTSSCTYLEVISYDYFLMTSSESYADGRTVTKPTPYGYYYAGDTSINPFRLMTFTYNSTDYDYEIDSSAKAYALLNYIVATYGASASSGDVITTYVNCPKDTFTNYVLYWASAGYSLQWAGTTNFTIVFIVKN